MLLISFHLRLYKVICALFPAAFWAGLHKCMYMLRCGVGLNPSYVTIGNSLNFSNPVSLTIKWEYSYVTPWGCCMGGLNETECRAAGMMMVPSTQWPSALVWLIDRARNPESLLLSCFSLLPQHFLSIPVSALICVSILFVVRNRKKSKCVHAKRDKGDVGCSRSGADSLGFPCTCLPSWADLSSWQRASCHLGVNPVSA